MTTTSFALFLVPLLAAAPALAGLGGTETYVFHLDGGQEVPPIPSPRTGGCMGILDLGASEFDIVCAHDVVNATLIHIHDGDPGINGPVVFDMGDPTSPVSATWTGMSAGEIAELQAGGYYVNIHSGGRPGGEVRGQILPRTVDSFDFRLSGDQQVPPDFENSWGLCFSDLSDDATAFAIDCTHNVVDPTVAHIHLGASGVNGPVVHEFADPSSPISDAITISQTNVARLAAGLLYVNVHSKVSPGGELRGQIVDSLIFSDGFESGDTAAWSVTVP